MPDPIRVDIISDVVCPWCIVGFRQLEQAAEATGVQIEIYWHPFELNPDMPPEGENLRDHIMRKYGSTPAQSKQARESLQGVGVPLGIEFQFNDDSTIVNTFQAHQLLHWAQDFGKAQDLKLALFDAYFTKGLDVSLPGVLADVAGSVGLDTKEALAVLQDNRFADTVREKQSFWTSRGVSSVPTMVFDARHATSGAQGAETFARVLTHLASEKGAA
ncbi:Predicted dithiol-disulfide isomerase, DsbA family [Shimia gijangensis]|uniref:Predicted dithiol-disulfide isomerase, DsbA family n=1 Tax=Shimia gijangensis TaxID=1470563 RepID=A0A1M6G285_9RHOB|nr:DsbA family oxidoreductase [Shimia gijangensis]SHJ04066.1 Predicted dithiol-disulfide isomerase, DsbA family [Shimia gijangensis]